MLLRNDKQPITGSVERGIRSPHGLKELAYMKRKSAAVAFRFANQSFLC